MLTRIIIIYLIIVLIYFRVHNVKINKIEKFIFAICIPIFGLASIIFSEMPENILGESKTENLNNHKNKIEKSKEFLTHIQSSILDNLIVEDYEKDREIILSMQALPLKKQCQICEYAIWSKNIEIAHISAVSLMRVKTSFEKFLVHMETYADLSRVENLERYINGLDNYLKCKIVYGSLKDKYIRKIISLTKELISKKSECEEKYYHILINGCIQVKEYIDATLYANLLIEKYGESEKLYKDIIEICYEAKDINKLKETTEKIKNMPNITKEAKNIVRFWEGEFI